MRRADSSAVRLHAPPQDEGLPTKVCATFERDVAPTPFQVITAGWPRVRNYEILSVIGQGGMGIVYKARHRDLGRTVALKTLRVSALVDPEFRDRFRVEAEAVARLQHPNIIQVFETGTVEPLPGEVHPSPFLALELVDGGSLALRTGKPQPPRYAAEVVLKLARAVHAAHRLGVIHRDLKPANVLLTHDGEPKIADFGLAKQVGGTGPSPSKFETLAGTVMGTPEYMAPEQAAGAAPTPAVDTYALGVILYELLVGRVPFQGANPIETMDLLRQEDPVSLRRLQRGLPRDLETICLKCLEKDPAKRYASAEALAADLRRFLDDRPILARRVGEFEKLARWCKRNPMAACSLAAVVTIFLAAFAVVWHNYWRAEAARQDEALQRHEAQWKERAERWERYRANIVAAASAQQAYNVDSARRALEDAPEGHRNWEWRHFHSRLDLAGHVGRVFEDGCTTTSIVPDGRRVALRGHIYALRVWDAADRKVAWSHSDNATIHNGSLSPDGKTLAYPGADNTVVLRDLATDRPRAVLRGHARPVRAYHFSADGTRLVTESDEPTLRFWDVASATLVRAIDVGYGDPVTTSLSPDGRRFATSQRGGRTLYVWDVDTGSRVAALAGQEHALQTAIFDGRSERLLTVEAYPGNVVRLWSASGRLVNVLRGHTNSIPNVAFSPDGGRIATCSRDQTARLWDAEGELVAVLKGHSGWLNAVRFSPDGRRLLTASQDHTARVWDAQTGEPLTVLHGHTADVYDAAYSADGREIVTASQDGTVRTWDAAMVERNGFLRGHTNFVYGVAFHPDGERVATAAWDGTARIWDATTGRQLAQLDHGNGAIVTAVAFHPGGKLLATRDRQSVRLWDAATGKEEHRWDVSSAGWQDTRLAFSPDGALLATGAVGRAVHLWDVARRAEAAVLRGLPEQVRDLAFSPDGRWLALALEQDNRTVRIWDLATMEQAHVLEGHTNCVYALAFSADGTRLASGSTDGTARVWDTATWRQVAELRHGTNVYGVAFTKDGTRLACGCADNSIRLWDMAKHQEVAELRGHGAYVHQVAFSPDGTRLASASGDFTARVWDTVRPQDRVR